MDERHAPRDGRVEAAHGARRGPDRAAVRRRCPLCRYGDLRLRAVFGMRDVCAPHMRAVRDWRMALGAAR
jgi:hypothetical protein